MGFLSSIFSPNAGASFQAQQPNQQNPLTMQDVHIAGANQAQQTQQQQALLNALAAQNGIQNQSNVFNQQQGLANQLQAESMGQGPNPAQQALANATGQNVANQASLMAGQRGTGANAGLLARQAAQQGAGIQQQAVGQGALMQLQQQLAAQQQLQQQQQAMAGLAGTQVGQQLGTQQNLAGNTLAEQQAQLGAFGQQNQQAIQNAQQANQANAQIQAGNQQAQLGLLSGVGGAAVSQASPSMGSGLMAAFSDGGMAGYSSGGEMNEKLHPRAKYAEGGPVSKLGKHMKNMKSGGHVDGQAQVKGDSPKNDTVPAMLSPGEVVIPRSVMQGKNPAQDSAKFVQAVLAKKGMR